MSDPDDGMPFANELRWRMSVRNPNDNDSVTAVPRAFDRDSLYAQTILELEDALDLERRVRNWYREIASAAFDALHKQRDYIRTLHDVINTRAPR